MRNDIIKSAFNKEDISTVKSKIRDFYSLYTEVVTLNGSCVNKNVVLNFNELSDMAQATILELGTAVLTINLDYQYNSNNGKLNKGDILKDTVSTLEGELIPQLINKGNRK